MSNNLVINNLFQALEDKEASNINGGHYYSHRKKWRYKHDYYHRCYGRKKYSKKYWKYGDHD